VAYLFLVGRTLAGVLLLLWCLLAVSTIDNLLRPALVGKDTKMVLTGDPYQIDNPYLDASSNGLTYLVEAFKGQELYGHVFLDKSERSVLAELAAELL